MLSPNGTAPPDPYAAVCGLHLLNVRRHNLLAVLPFTVGLSYELTFLASGIPHDQCEDPDRRLDIGPEMTSRTDKHPLFEEYESLRIPQWYYQ